MNNQLQKLIELQAIDREILEFDRILASVPGQIKSGQADMDAVANELAEAKEVIADMKKSTKQLEADVQSENDHMAKIKTKLTAVKTNKEYTAILTEVESVKEKVSVFEDKELEIMESLEKKAGELPAIESRFKEEESNFKEYKAKKEVEFERVKGEREVVIGKRQGILDTIEPKRLELYNKVLKRNDGVAVVAVRDSMCQGCFHRLRPQMVIDIKIGEDIVECAHCYRFLYWVEENEDQTSAPNQRTAG
jgi:predicted  nucleic acid-binding Zn-ribbon protein